MSDVSGQKIAELFFSLKVNITFWSKLHLEQVFSINGKGEVGKLTMQQFHFLLCIRDLGINTVSQISNSFCLSKSSTSLSIAKLVKKGYLEKELPSNDDDGRKIYFRLTDKANATVDATQNALMNITSSYFDSFDDETKQTLYHHLSAINQLIISGGTLK
ncbi:MarR family protein [Anaerotignum neopropionicum]|uniref:MarR family protein n=1 Tax=Anaerotignum neopropionicum TaxID=36847 RepID=A0A136WIT5_9FIRM|nr:MarR family transcriptional regulator [Anaerotignum neopropionicum]KXL54185.1 MarR family protein [Anaerotignum neopropionicum]KXL54310.1 MarR family protein [Anaerotignum neopropionicum]